MSAEHLQQIAQRIANAEANLTATLVEMGGISEGEAMRVATFYKKEKLVRLDLTNQRYTVKHGGYWERDVIRRAVEMSIVNA